MSDNPPAGDGTSFQDAYGVLQKHAETLRNLRANIDDLLRIVTESLAADQTCQQRIDAVEAALEQTLAGSGEGTPTA